jgi:acetyltransferase
MSIENLDRMFHPRSVAVVGASEKNGAIGNAVFRNLLSAEFKGTLFPVNPNHDRIMGIPSYPRLEAIGHKVDLVVAATPIDLAPDIVKDSGKIGAGGVIIIAGGGKERGDRGREIEAAIRQAATDSGVRVIGPNCLGIVSTPDNLDASFASQMPLPGGMAFISQSGGVNAAILDLSIKEHIGFRYVVSLGSMLDVNFGDMIDYLGGDPQVSSIVMYMENLTRFRGFMSAARAVSRVKPIIALKAGRTRAGAAAAMSHTGALAGEDAVYDAAFKRAGIIRVKTFEELFDCAALASKQPRIKGPGLAILTNSGGPGVMATDALSDFGAEPVIFSADTLEKLNAILPPHWSHGNPVDILGDASSALFEKTVRICREAREVNGLLIMLAPDAVNDPTAIAESLVTILKERPFPIFTVWLGGPSVERGRDLFNRAGIPTFDTPERAVRAYMDFYRYFRNIETLQEIPPKLPTKPRFERNEADELIRRNLSRKRFHLTELEAKSLLKTYGIPVNETVTVTSKMQAVLAAEKIGFPVAMKINSRDILHKSDAGGVRLNIADSDQVSTAFDQITTGVSAHYPNAEIEGVSIQQMIPRSEVELIVGSKKDKDFGPVILFGLGGTFTEAIQDRAIGLPPLNRLLAGRIMEETKAFRLLQGFRHYPAADLVRLEEILIRVSQLVTDFPEIEELDINPIFVDGKDIVAVDARIILAPSERPSPLHLVISSYPVEQEFRTTVQEVGEILVRPVKPEDAPLFVSLFDMLSRQSIYNRFFGHLKKLPSSMLARFTQVDYDREIALVAILEKGGEEKMMGVSRIIQEYGGTAAEFAVLVADEWHGKGIGATLLKQCLLIAKKRNLPKVWGIVLAENRQMLALGRKLGFKIERKDSGGEFHLSIDLQTLETGDLCQK